MTREQIVAILDRVRSWPPERQEDAANILLEIKGENTAPYEFSGGEMEDIADGLREADRREFARDEEVAAVLMRYRR